MHEILATLGKGTYGIVYKCRNINTNEVYAIKKNYISPMLNLTVGCLRELDILTSICNHPGIVRLINIELKNPFNMPGALAETHGNYVVDKTFFIFEIADCDGERFIHPPRDLRGDRREQSSAAVLSREQSSLRRGYEEKKRFLKDIALALEFLHSRGIYHRDVKPSNVLCFFSPDGSLSCAKLTDFGLAARLNTSLMSIPGFVTLWYRAPEISLLKDYDTKVDVWSLACIAFELFSQGGRRFVEEKDDETLLGWCLSKLPFTEEDMILARQLYPRRTGGVSNAISLPSVISLLGYSKITLSPLNATNTNPPLVPFIGPGGVVSFSPPHTLASPPNFTTRQEVAQQEAPDEKLIFEEFPNMREFSLYVDLIEKSLVIDQKKRIAMYKFCNSEFLFSQKTKETRRKFGIDDRGEWILKKTPTFLYRSCPERRLGMKFFCEIFNSRHAVNIIEWYNHEVFFHAIEMFDRYLFYETPLLSNVRICINTFLFMATKYFRIMMPDFSINTFLISLDINSSMNLINFEEYVVKLFRFEIYKPTLYEMALGSLPSEKTVSYLIELIFKEKIPNGTSFDAVLHSCKSYIANHQMILGSQVASGLQKQNEIAPQN